LTEIDESTTRIDRRLVMLGNGGHARVLEEVLALEGLAVSGYLAPDPGSGPLGAAWLGTDSDLDELDRSEVFLVNAIGSVRAGGRRRSMYESCVALGFEFLTIVDPTSIVRPSASLGKGVQILAGVIVNSDSVIGANTIVNSGSIIEHGSSIGSSVHVSPGVVLGGGVTVGDGTHVGLGARVLHGVSIGSECTIGAGAVVTRDIGNGVVAVGIPAVTRSVNAAD
jgi:sugar O-acyltransferase (sialic acid O-acetyltransferase NeuD family)